MNPNSLVDRFVAWLAGPQIELMVAIAEPVESKPAKRAKKRLR